MKILLDQIDQNKTPKLYSDQLINDIQNIKDLHSEVNAIQNIEKLNDSTLKHFLSSPILSDAICWTYQSGEIGKSCIQTINSELLNDTNILLNALKLSLLPSIFEDNKPSKMPPQIKTTKSIDTRVVVKLFLWLDGFTINSFNRRALLAKELLSLLAGSKQHLESKSSKNALEEQYLILIISYRYIGKKRIAGYYACKYIEAIASKKIAINFQSLMTALQCIRRGKSPAESLTFAESISGLTSDELSTEQNKTLNSFKQSLKLTINKNKAVYNNIEENMKAMDKAFHNILRGLQDFYFDNGSAASLNKAISPYVKLLEYSSILKLIVNSNTEEFKNIDHTICDNKVAKNIARLHCHFYGKNLQGQPIGTRKVDLASDLDEKFSKIVVKNMRLFPNAAHVAITHSNIGDTIGFMVLLKYIAEKFERKLCLYLEDNSVTRLLSNIFTEESYFYSVDYQKDISGCIPYAYLMRPLTTDALMVLSLSRFSPVALPKQRIAAYGNIYANKLGIQANFRHFPEPSKTLISKANKFAADNNLSQNSILLAPLSNSVNAGFGTTQSFQQFWQDSTKHLKEKGYIVYLNSHNKGEESGFNINECTTLNIPLDIMVCLMSSFAAFIGMRSGLCDLLCFADTKKYVIYPYGHIGKGLSEYGFEERVVNTDSYDVEKLYFDL